MGMAGKSGEIDLIPSQRAVCMVRLGANLRIRIITFTLLAYCLSITGALILAQFGDGCQRRLKAVLKCSAKDIQTVVIKPYPEYGTPLVTQEVTITDHNDIEAICEALNLAKPHPPNHPQTMWQAVAELHNKTRIVSFYVTKTMDEKNGTLVYIFSHITYGWLYGVFRSDELGTTLERIVKTRRSSKPSASP